MRPRLILVMFLLVAACRPAGAVAGHVPGHDDVPVYPRAAAAGDAVESGRSTTFTFTVPDGVNAPAVISFYRNALPDQHWRTITDTGSAMLVEKSDRTVNVGVTDAKEPMLLVVR